VANHFGDRLTQAVKDKRTQLIVGIDPVYASLPKSIITHKDMNDENDAAAAVDAILEFSRRVLRTVAPLVPAVKINIAYFEKYLTEGLEAYYSLVTEAEELGVEIIGDVKRGDIGHTAEAYAEAHLMNPDFADIEELVMPDAITINGFAGVDGILPFADVANENGKGVFVWVRASNPSAAALQDFTDAGGQKMYEKLAEIVASVANQPGRIGESGYSNIGMIVGGTSPEATAALRKKYDKIWFLVPGFGAQGATAADCIRFSKPDGTGALISASRSIIYAYEKPAYQTQFGDNWEKCIEQAVADARVELSKALQKAHGL
jgi:orotidine-5'-phosphate decarboxylase